MDSAVSAAADPIGLKRFFAALPGPVERFPKEVTVEDPVVAHHLKHVLRAKPEEAVVIIDDMREIAYQAIVQKLEKGRVLLSLTGLLAVAENPLPYATLAVALIKEQRWDLLLQKATELGVRAIQPLVSERTVIRIKPGDVPKKLARWHAVLRSAAEQSEGLYIPQILPPVTVAEFCQGKPPGTFRFLLAERGPDRQPLNELLPDVRPGQSVVFAIGPEGGWSPAEMDTFRAAGFEAVSLGSRILRSETAAMAAMSALVYESGP